MTRPLFTFSVIPKLNVCERFTTVDAPWHVKRRCHTYVVEIKGKPVAMLCTYCWLIFVADTLQAWRKAGATDAQVKAWLPNGPSNAKNVDGVQQAELDDWRRRKEEREEARYQ